MLRVSCVAGQGCTVLVDGPCGIAVVERLVPGHGGVTATDWGKGRGRMGAGLDEVGATERSGAA